MGLVFRRTKQIDKNTRMYVSKSGVSFTRKFGPVSVNSRGHVTIHLAKGLSFRIL